MNAAKTSKTSDRDLMNNPQAKREADRAQANRDELTERIAQAIRHDGTIEPLKGVHFNRSSSPSECIHSVSVPAFCVIAQGSKEVLLGSDRYQYDPMHYLLATAELPIVSQILEASKEKPYLSLRLDLDPTLVGSVMVEAGHPSSRSRAEVKAIDVSPLDANLLDAVVRLVRLLDSPAEAHVLAPLIKREIIYRLLMGEQGNRLRQIAVLGGYTHHIARALERLRKDFNQPLRIESIARELGMSVSGFHHHFKSVTAMSPLQFQKQLRLQEARRLMLGQNLDATSAAYRVGYDDASHFNREYKRLFGAPPMRDVERLREATRETASSI
jgi:AraC-like DNA-binding protein